MRAVFTAAAGLLGAVSPIARTVPLPILSLWAASMFYSTPASRAGRTATPGDPVLSRIDPCCCITDGVGYYRDPREKIDRRFALYRRIGADSLRVEIGWRDLEGGAEGRWDENCSGSRRYLEAVRRSDFAVKMIAGTIMAPPGWFLDAHPDARIVNEDGGHSRNTVSYWYPGLRPLLERILKREFEYLKRIGLLDQVRYVVADFGPAGEPIYPACWTLGPGFTRETFWGYDSHARADFRREMRKRYRTIARMNAAWGTNFSGWDAVTVPLPGTRPGRAWEDVLTWYRDSKREFVSWQIDNFQRHARRYLGRRARVLVYVPGSDIRDEEWQDAIRTGSGGTSVRLMADSRWLMETAARKGCVLQYTGAENRAEVEHLRRFLDRRGMAQVSFWAENAGVPGAASDPVALADIVVKNRLLGLDYTHSHFLFGDDHVTPNAIVPQLEKAFAAIRADRGTKDRPRFTRKAR